MADTSLDAVIAEIIQQWRADNPTATQIPRGVRQELSRAVREDARNQQVDTAIARSQIELEILHHQKAMTAGMRRAPEQGEAEWAANQQRLAAAAEALERRIHEVPGLGPEDRGNAIAALHRAHNNPGAESPQRVEWERPPGRASLAARLVERLSAIRLGFAVATRELRAPLFAAARAEAEQRTATEQPLEGAEAWLTPAQAAAVSTLTDAARRWEQTAALTAGTESTYLSTAIQDFGAALQRAQQLGVPAQRIDRELAAVHRDAAAVAAPTSRWDRLRAAAGPLTPPIGTAGAKASPVRGPATTPVGVPAPVATPGRTR